MSETYRFFYIIASLTDGVSAGSRARVDERVLLLAGVSLTVAASFATRIPGLLASAALGGVLAAMAGKAREWLVVTLVAMFFSLVVSIPYILQLIPSSAAVSPTLFIARVTVASSVFTGFYSYMGWLGLLKGLRRLKMLGGFENEIAFTLRFIPLFALRAARMLMAREARIFTTKIERKLAWKMHLSVAGDLIAGGFSKAYTSRLAFNARSFGGQRGEVRFGSIRLSDLGFAAVTILIAALCLV